MSWSNLEGVLVPVLALPRCLPTETKGAKMLPDGQSPAALLASELACLPTSKAWHNCKLLPLNLGHASGKAFVSYRGLITSITKALWVRSSHRWLHYSPLICLPLSQPLSLEGSAEGRDLLPSCTVFPCEGLQRLIRWETALGAGRGITPTKEVPLEGASATVRCKEQMWQHLEVCHEIQPLAKNHSPPPQRGLAVRSGHPGKGQHGSSCGGRSCLPNLLVSPEHLSKGDADEFMHLNF